MLTKFWNSESGKVFKTTIIAWLVFLLTFANVFVLVPYVMNSYAADVNLENQGTKTNEDNVEFKAYFKQDETETFEIAKKMNEELILNLAVSVKNGFLVNGKIDFENSNFVYKETGESFINLPQIDSKDANFEIPIKIKKIDSVNLNYFNMTCQIKLNGTYVVNNSEEKPVEATKYVKVEWQSVETEKPIISQEIITNKVLNIAGENKRIIQLKVNTKLAQILYPIGQNYLEINVPKFGDIQPEKVNVMAYETKLTNEKGKEAFSKENYSYSQENNVLEISVNNEADENENIYWANENLEDSFVITYIYDENVNIENTTSKITDSLALHDGTTLENENEISLENLEEKENVILLKEYTSNPIYKGNMYIGGTTSYDVLTDICVTYKNAAEALAIESTPETVGIIDNGKTVIEAVNSQITSTKIDAKQAKNLLGEDGEITISTKGENPEELSKIKLSEHSEDIIEVSYENPVSEIQITTSNVVKEGRIKVQHSKQIIIEEKTQEEIQKFEGLYTATKVSTTGTTQTSSQTNSRAELKEPETAIELSVDKTEINTLSENEIGLRTVLKSNSSKYKLFKNPTIEIELPSEITDAVIDNNQLAYAENELTIKNSEITTNENGNKVLKIELEGEQTKYSKQDGINIVTDLKLKSNKLIADKNVDIIATCINNGTDRAQDKKSIDILSKRAILNRSNIQVGNNTPIENTNSNEIITTINDDSEITINTNFVNNKGEKITNTNLIGELPEEATLTSNILTNIENAEVYYSTEKNVKEDSESWVNNIEDLSNIKSFKIILGDIEQTASLQTTYKFKINNEAIKTQRNFSSTLNMNYVFKNQPQQENVTFKLNNTAQQGEKPISSKESNGIELSISSKTTTQVLHEGQIITYSIKAKNTSKTELNNIKLNYLIPEGTVYTELLEAQASILDFEDNPELSVKTWDIEKLVPNGYIEENVTIKIKSGTEQIVNKVEIKNSAENEEVIANIITEPAIVNKAKLEVRLSRGLNSAIALDEGKNFTYFVFVKNISGEELHNLNVEAVIPDGLKFIADSEDSAGWNYNSENKTISKVISDIKKDETKELTFEVIVDSVEDSKTSVNIENTVVVKDEQNNIYETNAFTSNVKVAKWTISQSAEHEQILKDGSPVKYIIEIKNIGEKGKNVYVKDNIPEYIDISSIKYYIDNEFKEEIDDFSDNNLELSHFVDIGKTLKIEIEGTFYEIANIKTADTITNIAKVDLGNEKYLESNAITNTIEKTIEPGEPDEPIDPGEPDEPIDSEQKYSISGIAWLDENKNGIREENEKVLPAIKVILLDENRKQVLDEKKQAIYTMTSVLGTYKFNNLAKGRYLVAFVFDTDKYKITKYKVEDAEETTNSDVIFKKITIDSKETDAGITDIIKIEDSNIENIDIGLAKNSKSKLILNKYIEKVVVNNKGGTATYTYKNTDFAKVEISAKYLDSSNVAIEYAINITNDGDIIEYVSDVVDYFPKELTFNSEMNSDWYKESDGSVHNINLTEEEINPGETKTIKIIATKTLNENGTGTIENMAEIGASSNLENVKDETSKPGNKQDGEDDMSKATLIISIKTGGAPLYIGIVIASLIILGAGIYLIDKKVLKGGK